MSYGGKHMKERIKLSNILAENLPLFRKKLHLSQSQFADIIGVSRYTIVAIENKKSELQWSVALAIIMALSTHGKETKDLLVHYGIDNNVLKSLLYENANER